MMSWLQQLVRRVASAITPESNHGPRDPYSYVRQPIVHRPSGRNAAVALEEPDEDQNLTLVGRH
jgi:hypothetical protein